MAMKSVLAIAALVVPLLAGCFGGNDNPPPATPPTATSEQLAAAAPYTIFLCKAGYRIGANATRAGLDECNHRVTHPLANNMTFDWTTQHGPANEVSVSVNPTNPLNIAGGAKDYTVSYIAHPPTPDCGKYTVWMGTFSSLDGGLSWNDDLMPGFPGDDRPSAIQGNTCNTDPVVVFGDDGTLLYSGLNYGGAHAGQIPNVPNPLYPASSDATTATQIYFARSNDGGKTYDGSAISFCGAGDNGLQFNDKQWFAIQPGGGPTAHAIVTWTPYYSTPPLPGGLPDPTGLLQQSTSLISYCDSLDGGKTWQPQRTFAPGMAAALDSQFSMPAYLPGGQKVAVIWAADTDSTLPASAHPTGDLLAYTEGTVTPGGTAFAPVMSTFPLSPIKSGPGRDGTGPSHFRVATYPVLAVDTSSGPHSGRRYVVAAEQAGPLDSDVDLFIRHSDDGLAWSSPLRVSDTSKGDQYVPWVDVDPQGGVHVAWYDRRNSPDNRLLDVYYAYSSDGGESFHPNIRVTEAPFDGDLGHHQSGAPFIGDYIGLDTSKESVPIFWSDTRHSGEPGRLAGSDVYAATLLRDTAARSDFDAAYRHP